MTDNPNVGEQEQTGAGSPNPVSSGTAKPIEAPQSSQEFQELRRELELTRKELKGIQSVQDKGDKRFREFLDEYEKNVANGMSKVEASSAAVTTLDSRSVEQKRNQLIDQLIERELGTSIRPVSASNEQEKVIAKAGVSANDPDVAKLIAENNDPIDLAVKLGEYKTRLANRPAPSASDASPMPANAGTGQVDVKQLTAQYQKEMVASQGKPAQAREVKEKYRKLGVPVDSVVFL